MIEIVDPNQLNGLLDAATFNLTARVNFLKDEQARLTKIQSLYSGIKSDLSSLKTAVADLNSSATYDAKKASASDEKVFTASAASSAAPGTLSVVVNSLARQHQVASSARTATATALSTALGAGTQSFEIKVGGTTENFSVVLDGTETDEKVLTATRDAINAASSLVVASVIKESDTTATLVLYAKDSGAANQITLKDTTGSLLETSGFIDGAQALQRVLATAQDASFTVNGTLTVTRSTNEIKDGVAGVTMTLKGTGTANLVVQRDASAIADKFKAFVEKYNAVMENIATQINEKRSEEDPLQGLLNANSFLRSIRQQIRSGAVNTTSQTPLASLADLGITAVNALTSEPAKSLNLQIDETKLTTAVDGNIDALKSLMTDATEGIAANLETYLNDTITKTKSPYDVLTKSLTKRLGSISNRIDEAEETETRRRSALEDVFRSQLESIEILQSQTSLLNQFLGGLL